MNGQAYLHHTLGITSENELGTLLRGLAWCHHCSGANICQADTAQRLPSPT